MSLLNDIYAREMGRKESGYYSGGKEEENPAAAEDARIYNATLQYVLESLNGKSQGINEGGTGVNAVTGAPMSIADSISMASQPPNAYLSALGSFLGTAAKTGAATVLGPYAPSALTLAGKLTGVGDMFNTQAIGNNALESYGISAEDLNTLMTTTSEIDMMEILSQFETGQGESPTGTYDGNGNLVSNDFTGFTYSKSGEPTGFQFGTQKTTPSSNDVPSDSESGGGEGGGGWGGGGIPTGSVFAGYGGDMTGGDF
jgi:hypothetical protein